MPSFDQYAQKRVLIVDDIAEMRASLRAQVANLGITRIHQASNIREALALLAQHPYDLILSDYFLGEGTNGQQFLEYLRTRNLISRATVFIIVTAEQNYESVITAAETMPDDYLIKPFTAATLAARIDRIMDRKARLASVDRLQDTRRWGEVVSACDEILAAKDKYFIDALRIKGNALLAMHRFEEARAFYERALAMRSMPWAKLGLAKALDGAGETERAIVVLQDMTREFPNFMVAYDQLSHILKERGQTREALETLQKATQVSPNSLGRQRNIAAVAETLGEPELVERAMNHVLQQTRNTPLQEPMDYARLGNALIEKGTPDKALAVLKEARRSFTDVQDGALLAAVECIAHHRAGDEQAARQAYEEASRMDPDKAPEAVALVLAKACLVQGDQTRGEAILKRLVQNSPDSAFAKAQVAALMTGLGQGERAEQLLQASEREVIELNNRAVQIGQQGQLAEAAQMLAAAADQLPGNLLIVANAAYALLADLARNGFDRDKLDLARRYTQQVHARNAQYPKLVQIAELMRQVQAKYPEARGA